MLWPVPVSRRRFTAALGFYVPANVVGYGRAFLGRYWPTRPALVLPKAAVVATIHNALPALVVGVVVFLLWEPVFGVTEFGFGMG